MLRRSPQLGFYVDAVRAGWSVRQLARYAERYFGERISRESFRLLALAVPRDETIPAMYRQTVLHDVDVEIEPLVELQNLIAVQKIRVTNALAFETGLTKRKEGGGVTPLKSTREEIAVLHQMLTDYANVQANLGLLHPPDRLGGGERVDVVEQEIRETMLVLTDAQREHLHRAFREIEGTLTTDLPPVEDAVGVSEHVSVLLSAAA